MVTQKTNVLRKSRKKLRQAKARISEVQADNKYQSATNPVHQKLESDFSNAR
jgi:hypothetical protein